MPRLKTLALSLVLLGIGYVMGSLDVGLFSVRAQGPGNALSDDAVGADLGNRVRNAHRALNDARDALASAGRYEALTEEVNAFLVLAGGGNARQDLESGRGVDPETFAALYAGRAVPEIEALLSTDEEGRITYNNEVVRLYPRSVLQRIFAERTKILESGQ